MSRHVFHHLVATISLEDVVVLDTADASLVCNRNRAQEVRDQVAELNRREMVKSVVHPTVERPWGGYTVMNAGPNYQVKLVEVGPGRRLSLQYHNFRAEHWVVVQGVARVTIGREINEVATNEGVYVPRKTAHRLENIGTKPLCTVEVQTGS